MEGVALVLHILAVVDVGVGSSIHPVAACCMVDLADHCTALVDHDTDCIVDRCTSLVGHIAGCKVVVGRTLPEQAVGEEPLLDCILLQQLPVVVSAAAEDSFAAVGCSLPKLVEAAVEHTAAVAVGDSPPSPAVGTDLDLLQSVAVLDTVHIAESEAASFVPPVELAAAYQPLLAVVVVLSAVAVVEGVQHTQ